MKRGYTALEYKSIVRRLREARPGHLRSPRISSSASRARPRRDFEATLRLVRRARLRRLLLLPLQPAARARRRRSCRRHAAGGEARRACSACRRSSRRRRARSARRWSARAQRVLVEGAVEEDPAELAGRTENNRVVNFAGAADSSAASSTCAITAALAHIRCAASSAHAALRHRRIAKPSKSASTRSTTSASRTCAARSTRTCARSRPRSTSRSRAAASASGARRAARRRARAARALERFYEQATRGPQRRRRAARPGRDVAGQAAARSEAGPQLLTRRADLHGRTPHQVRVPREHPRARHHLRHRPGRHRQDLSRGGLRGGRARARRGEAHRAGAARRWRPASGSASCPATWRRRSIPTCARCTTRSTT